MTVVRLSGGFADGLTFDVSELDSGLLPDTIEVPIAEGFRQRYTRPATGAIKGTPVYTFAASQQEGSGRPDPLGTLALKAHLAGYTEAERKAYSRGFNDGAEYATPFPPRAASLDEVTLAAALNGDPEIAVPLGHDLLPLARRILRRLSGDEGGAPPVLDVIHQCPPKGSGIMPCCGRTPFEAMGDRMAIDPARATCTGVQSPGKSRDGGTPSEGGAS